MFGLLRNQGILHWFWIILCNAAVAIQEGIPVVQPFIFPEHVSSGQKAGVTCMQKSGLPGHSIIWLKNGQELVNSPTVQIQTFKGASLLTLDPVTADSSGNYSCILSNSVGKDTFTASLVVRVPPKWIFKPNDIGTFAGSSLELKCEAEGYPKPVVSWMKEISKNDFQKLISSPRYQLSEEGSLNIASTTEQDSGRYKCEANNGVDQPLTSVIVVTVNVPARFEEKFSVETVRQGDSAVLRCDATGDPPLTVTWSRDKKELEIREASRYEKFETYGKNGVNSELFIRNVDRRDGALYTCVATNSYGTDEKNIKVLVVEVPAQPLDVKVLEMWSRSASVRWSAPYAGNSQLTKYVIQYWRDRHGPQRLHEEEIAPSHTTTVIKNLKPGIPYALSVMAENEVGHGEPSEVIRFLTAEEEPSGPPTDLWVEPRGPSTIAVKWKPPPKEFWNGKLKGYYVGYKLEGTNQPYSSKTVEATSNSTQEYLLTNLMRSTRYTVVVKAYNGAGIGPPSQELVVKTLDGDLPKSPPLSLASSSDTTISVAWNQMVTREDPLTGYTIHYQKGAGHWLHVPLLSPEKSAYTLTGLQSDTLYRVYLTANNRHGRGYPSEVLNVKTKEKGTRAMPFYMDLSILIPAAAALFAFIVVAIVVIVYMLKSRSREHMVQGQIKALHGQQYIYAAANAQRYADIDKARPYSQPEPGTSAASLASYASIPSRIDQDEMYGGPPELKNANQNYKERPSSFPRPKNKKPIPPVARGPLSQQQR